MGAKNANEHRWYGLYRDLIAGIDGRLQRFSVHAFTAIAVNHWLDLCLRVQAACTCHRQNIWDSHKGL